MPIQWVRTTEYSHNDKHIWLIREVLKIKKYINLGSNMYVKRFPRVMSDAVSDWKNEGGGLGAHCKQPQWSPGAKPQ